MVDDGRQKYIEYLLVRRFGKLALHLNWVRDNFYEFDEEELDRLRRSPEYKRQLEDMTTRELRVQFDEELAEEENFSAVTTSRAGAKAPVDETELHPRRENSLLRIIGALLNELKLENSKPQAEIIKNILEVHSDKDGISKTTLENDFADANRLLNSD